MNLLAIKITLANEARIGVRAKQLLNYIQQIECLAIADIPEVKTSLIDAIQEYEKLKKELEPGRNALC